jgi:hypothetical protein
MASGQRTLRYAPLIGLGLLLLLLVIQVVQAVEGFVPPHGGVLGVLELPGTLLGWGGVLVVAFALAWVLFGWWDRGFSRTTLRLLGVVALGLAVAGFLGLLAGPSGGGRVGTALGELLGETLGTIPALVLLALMAVPGFLLSASPLWGGTPTDGAARPVTVEELEPPPGLYEGSAGGTSYPARRYDEAGNEIPMSFGTTDVGPVRYLDEEAEEEPVRAPEPVEAPDPDELPFGVRFADEPAPEPDTPRLLEVEYGRPDIPLPAGVRFADEPAPEPEPEPETELDTTEAAPTSPARAAVADDIVAPEALVGPAVSRTEPPPDAGRALDHAMEPLRDGDAAARYRAKLEGSGIFDEPAPPAAPAASAEATARKKPSAKKTTRKKSPAKKRTTKKKATKKKATKKTTAKKKAAKRTATKAAAKRKATKKKTVKKTTARKKAASSKKPRTTKQRATKATSVQAAVDVAAVTTGDDTRKGAASEEALYAKAVEVALDRGAASSVLLSRKLGIGYARARTLMGQLVDDGVLGEMAPSGSRPVLITEKDWKGRRS